MLVTGALGCVGAWALKAALDAGDEAVGLDLGDRTHRLELALSAEERARVTLVQGDITDLDGFGKVLDEHGITRVVHLAALQVPFCRADPALGARVNVVGTVNVFEAVKERLERIPGVAYASSAAVYGPDDPSPAPESGGTCPATFYGVTKLANEGTARLYWAESQVPSIGIRPSSRNQTSLSALLVDPAAGGDVLCVVVQQRVREADHPHDSLVGDPVVDDAMLAPRVDEAAPAQAGEMVRHLRLRHAEPLDQFSHRQLALVAQQLEDANAGEVAEAAEVLRDQVASDRCFRKAERGLELGHRRS